MDSLTPADLIAMTGTNKNGVFGDGSLWIIILFLFLFGGGFGGYGNNGNVLTNDFSMLDRKMEGIANGLSQVGYENARLSNATDLNMANGFMNAELSRANSQATLTAQINALQSKLQDCCCQNRYDALQNNNALLSAINTGFCQTNFNNQQNTRDIIENANLNTRSILDALMAQQTEMLKTKIADQNQIIQNLNLAASQAAQNQYLISQLKTTG